MLKDRHNFTQALSKWARTWQTPDLPQFVRVSFSPRLKRSLGRVRPKYGTISLHGKLSGAPRRVLLEILCHEAAHVAAYLLHGPRVTPHGPEWRALVRAVGYQPRTSLKCALLRDAPPSRSAAHKHCYRCPVCQTDHFVKRRSSKIVCGACFRHGVPVPLRLVWST